MSKITARRYGLLIVFTGIGYLFSGVNGAVIGVVIFGLMLNAVTKE